MSEPDRYDRYRWHDHTDKPTDQSEKLVLLKHSYSDT